MNKRNTSHKNIQHDGTVAVVSKDNNSPDDHGVRFAFGCIERSLPLITQELQKQISALEEKLFNEQQTRQELKKECDSLKEKLNCVEPIENVQHAQFDNGDFNEMEQIIEERNRLTEQLLNEQKKCKELLEENLRLKSDDSISLPTKIMQNHTSNGTSVEPAELPNSASSSSVLATITKPRNKTRKRRLPSASST